MANRRRIGLIAGLIVLTGVLILGANRYNQTRYHTLTYGNCAVKYKYLYSVDHADEGYVSAQNELALCLCDAYVEHKNPADSSRIMEIYHQYGTPLHPDSAGNAASTNLDSIIKHREIAFDKLAYFD